MRWRRMVRAASVVIIPLLGTPVLAAPQPKVEGSFFLGGVDAKLAHVRASRVVLEKGKSGYAVLLSARAAEGDISAWRTGQPAERGSFIYLLLEESGSIWVGELGHTARKDGRFGVVIELETAAFKVQENRLIAHVRTRGEQTFSDDRYTVDLTFEAPLEK